MASRAFLARVYAFRFLDGFVLIYPLYTVMFAARGLSPSQVAATLMAWSVTGFLLQIPWAPWPTVSHGVGSCALARCFAGWVSWSGCCSRTSAGFLVGMVLGA
jgi:hypothetical protein